MPMIPEIVPGGRGGEGALRAERERPCVSRHAYVKVGEGLKIGKDGSSGTRSKAGVEAVTPETLGVRRRTVTHLGDQELVCG